MYSYDDDTFGARDVDTDEDAGSPLDTFGRDVDTFDIDSSADSLADYLSSMFTEVDARGIAPSVCASARAHTVSALAMSIAVDVARMTREREWAHEQFTRYVNTHRNGAYVGTQRKVGE